MNFIIYAIKISLLYINGDDSVDKSTNYLVVYISLAKPDTCNVAFFLFSLWERATVALAVRQMQLGRAVALHPLCFLGSKFGLHKQG